MHELITGNCLEYLNAHQDRKWDTIFADPPDGIGLKYSGYSDKCTGYTDMLREWITCFIEHANTIWISYNAKWMFEIGKIMIDISHKYQILNIRPCVQVFTFGQHNQKDFSNDFRPLLRIQWPEAPLYPDRIRIPSWRQLNGDKRADPRGRVPSDVFYFTRVTGNSKQRRKWCPTQLNEGLIDRCLKMTTPYNGTVLDPFCGTGTTLRVCKTLGFSCTLIEISTDYSNKVIEEHKHDLTILPVN